ncbi:MAG: FAD-binding domain-containing protein [Roseicyclus sp.]
MTTQFPPTRAAGLERLSAFLPRAGRAYAAERNFDRPGHRAVSGLSPYLRHRLLTETEVIRAVLGRHSLQAAEKFVQEVFWRTYWKGWLERRPGVWGAYRAGLDRALSEMDGGLASRVAEAEAGRTGIACFDAWARELAETGYLHNHARMWTASIWIFTLRLPWEIGADWFLRHLLDGDPASNTLGWRWVAGMQTPGKHYVARASNIARYTEGRFDPRGELDEAPEPLTGPPAPPPDPVPVGDAPDPGLRTGLLLTEEDLSPGAIFEAGASEIAAHATLISARDRSPRPVADRVTAFTAAAIEDSRGRWAGRLGVRGPSAGSVEEVVDWAVSERLDQVVAGHAPVGPAAMAMAELKRHMKLRDIRFAQVVHRADKAAWTHATHGFFRFKEHIPDLVEQMTGIRG